MDYNSKKFKAFAALGFIIIIIGCSSFIIKVFRKVFIEGNGSEIYRSLSGFEISYASVLILLAIVPFAYLIGLFLAYLDKREERDLIRKYTKK